MKIHTFLFLFIMNSCSLYAQELNAKCVINTDKVQLADYDTFREMERTFARFLNSRKWTDDTFTEIEKINCEILITINEIPNIGNYDAEIQIVSSRPIYNTNYKTVIFNFADRDFSFQYFESKPLQFNETAFLSNITSLLAFYAHIIIGMDYDTFSEFGGNSHFEKAFDIVSNATSSDYSGWTQFSSNRNRFWLIENLRNIQLSPIRSALYQYHRKGLDLLLSDSKKAHTQLLEALKKIKITNELQPRSLIEIVFFDAKSSELVNTFSVADFSTKKEAYNILTRLDPKRTDRYEKIIR